ncbi:hypothetical protein QFZ42_000157 [Variovorax paradoxus]|nr:hypothetical protein [Variovorax paradoxus]
MRHLDCICKVGKANSGAAGTGATFALALPIKKKQETL